jgi:hypothetical protein
VCYIPNDSHEEYIEKRYKEFVLYFRELDRIGASYGTNDLIRKAQELRLPIPTDKEIEGIKN